MVSVAYDTMNYIEQRLNHISTFGLLIVDQSNEKNAENLSKSWMKASYK